jgi:nucleoside-diphosphate-sugar epimerase
MLRIVVTGGAGIAGQAVCSLLAEQGMAAVAADVAPPRQALPSGVTFVRCDTRTPGDVRQVTKGADGVIHLAAWHCAHNPPVSDDTIYAVNVDGTYNVLSACRENGAPPVVFASSMAYGWGSVYSATKVIGEELWRSYHEMTGSSVASLRYHDFVPKPYLDFGMKLLRNGVDVRDVASASVAAMNAAVARRFGRFMTIVHTAHGMPLEVVRDFRANGLAWCEEKVPGATALLQKYGLDRDLPGGVEQHDLSEAGRLMDWRPEIGFVEFLQDLKARDARGEDVRSLHAPGRLPAE